MIVLIISTAITEEDIIYRGIELGYNEYQKATTRVR